jgi:DNA-binding NtrC family response regulator
VPRSRILVVDDHASVLEVMHSILRSAYDVTTRSDSSAAIALVAAERFDLVMTDVRMPGADGFAVLAAATAAQHPPPVVMMTGFGSISDAVTAIKGGAFDYVVKPLDADDVALVVVRGLAKARAPTLQHADPRDEEQRGAAATQFKDAINAARERASREYLVVLLTEFRGNVTHAAAHAGVTRESLHRLLKKHSVRSEAFRDQS